MSWITNEVQKLLSRRGFVVTRHPASRRQALLSTHEVNLVLDVGAARGSYGGELREFGYRGRIVSFEPLSAAFADLARAAASDDSWTVVNAALGPSAGRSQIHVASNSDSSSLLPLAHEHLAAAPHIDYVTSEDVEVLRLDDATSTVLSQHTRAFLKIDAQGYEKQVLAGGVQTLHSCVGLQLELSTVNLYDGGMLIDEAVSWAYANGFVMAGLIPGFTSPAGALLQADGVFFRP